jgi:hypothetical protein
MPSLRLLSADNQLKIQNRQQQPDSETLQAVYLLINTWSPLEDVKHSLNDLIGTGTAGDDMIQDISVRMQSVGEILKEYYDVEDMTVIDIYDVDGTGQSYSIDLFILYVDGTYEQGTVVAEAA